MSFNVKITTTWSILDMLCPHTCRGCGRLGAVLCECCKKDIESSENYCPHCHRPMTRGRCGDCATGFDACYTCGFRDELVGELVEDFKYNSVRTLGQVLAEVLEAALPEIAGEVVVVPLPTIGRHVRERGFDHTLMVAKRLAKMRGWKCERVLARAKNTVQVGVGAKERRRQAGEAYKVVGEVRKGVTYVVLDDVWTTGASMKAGEKLLREAGAEVVLGAVLAISRR